MEKICQRCHKTHEEIKNKQLECHDDQGNYFDKHDYKLEKT